MESNIEGYMTMLPNYRERKMKEIQIVDQGAYNHLMEILAKYWSKSSVWQVNRDKFIVDLKNHKYSCKKFQLTGYPCEHAMSCIRKMCLNVKNYMNKYYKKETYVNCYQYVIYAVNGLNFWVRTQNDDVLPLVFRKPIGCPKLSRNKTYDKSRNNRPLSKLSRVGQQQKYSYCFALGHNKRTCSRKQKVKASTKKHNSALQIKKSADTIRTSNSSMNAAKITIKTITKFQLKKKNNTQVEETQ
ncbi:hypothetical protein Ahy_A07g032465 [Arachis hypogaea]|uniref:SWIM-type domain-containing protein n=1 Tax=Arachis hypogaea TaxID=3818 RepID=A0A445C6V6_ARAHY|nr:hypothetical protein Ahy_A07g032465 [Arachis hypogaea]